MKWRVDWSNAINPERVELVFANRNKEYGAYVIRKKYEKRVVSALLIALTGIVLAVAIPILINYLSKANFGSKDKMVDEVTLAEPPPIDKTTPPPPPVIPPPPVQQTIKFTPPVVVKDEEVQEPPPTQEEVKDVQVATKTQEGTAVVDLPPENPVVAEETTPFTIVEEMPTFPGGEEKMMGYLHDHIKYPQIAKENGITGRVYVKFVVDKEGKIKDATVLRGIGGGCDEEALRVIRTMPDWKPGKQNGRSVPVYFNLPINFSLK